MFSFFKSSNSPVPPTNSPKTSVDRSSLGSTLGADVFLRNALELLASKANNQALKDACTTALATQFSMENSVENVENSVQNSTGMAGNADLHQRQDVIFKPFAIAIQSRHKELVGMSVDVLGKLFGYGYFQNSVSSTSASSVDAVSTEITSTEPVLPASNVAPPTQTDQAPLEETQEAAESLEESQAGTLAEPQTETSADTQLEAETREKEDVARETEAITEQLDTLEIKPVQPNIVINSVDATDSSQQSVEPSQPVTQPPETNLKQQQIVLPTEEKQEEHTLIDLVIDTICDAFSGGETTSSQVQLQIINALSTACTTRGDQGVHTATLLKAIRTMYNVFLLSRDPQVQEMAQVALVTVVGHVFAQLNRKQDHLAIKDAFLVFRALCKLSMKPVDTITDLKSHGMRSKILSLFLVHHILTSNPNVLMMQMSVLFGEATPAHERLFLNGVKQYLMLILTRNLASPIPLVYDVVLDLFRFLVMSDARAQLKKEFNVLFVELILPILESGLESSVTFHQRWNLVKTLKRICEGRDGGRVLVEIYLNYDCDPEGGARDNVWERLISATSRLINLPVSSYTVVSTIPPSFYPMEDMRIPSVTTSAMITLNKTQREEVFSSLGDGAKIRLEGLQLLVDGVLKSLLEWSTMPGTAERVSMDARVSEDEERGLDTPVWIERQKSMDDPLAFENVKQRKLLLLDGVKKFNWKPKKGVAMLRANGLVGSSSMDVARFLLQTEGLNKTIIGEYLGEGEEENIVTMHAFVDLMDFNGQDFTTALRSFLQAFRLPGEAQKIDRFMLKFAERFVNQNPGSFSSADTAYILAYSVIMLNTDLHNPQIKKHMTKEEFVKNNRGIDGGADLDRTVLETIYDEISQNEIKMKEGVHGPAEVKEEMPLPRKRLASEAMAQKTEALFTKLMRLQRAKKLEEVDKENVPEAKVSSTWFVARHETHVKAMFDLVWMSVLTALSGPLQSSDDEEVVKLCLRGLKLAILISCRFNMELETKAFVSTLGKFTQVLTGEMGPKNLEAIRVLLDVAASQGDALGEAWRDVAACISQLDRLSLLGREQTTSAMQTANQDFVVAVDRIFSNSPKLKGQAINDFVRALCQTSWDEISSSATWDHPRMYSLQKLVEISYYNMNRIRVEWASLWAILGEHLNKVGSHANPTVAAFALDKLRQLANKFMDIEELPNFKFQKDFLKPFEYILQHAPDVGTKDLVLHCIQQTIQLKSSNIKSGWRTIFNVINRAAREPGQSLVQFGFDMLKSLYQTHFDELVENNSLAEFVSCVVEFCKNRRYPKNNLAAMELLRSAIPRIATMASKSKKGTTQADDPNLKYWFPVLFGLYDVVMTCELEVRTRALTLLFETLRTFGNGFTRDFWEVICKGVLFPIFDDLKLSRTEKSRFDGEDMNVWLSTTLIKALREFVDLFGVYFDRLGFVVDGLLDLFRVCMTQENETLARIGSTSFLQFVAQNNSKFDEATWSKIASMFKRLFDETTPTALFSAVASEDGNGTVKTQMVKSPTVEDGLHGDWYKPADAPKDFAHTVMKCVLQLLVIQTLDEMLQSPGVYENVDSPSLLALLDCLESSHRFAKKFNEDLPLRQALYQKGYMSQLPNLLKQETISATSYLGNLVRLSQDAEPKRVVAHEEAVKRWLPLARDLLKYFSTLDPETKKRNVSAWKPVILLILSGLSDMDDETFRRNMQVFYQPCADLLLHELQPEVRKALHKVLLQAARVFGISSHSL